LAIERSSEKSFFALRAQVHPRTFKPLPLKGKTMKTTDDLTHQAACDLLKEIVGVMNECFDTTVNGSDAATERDLRAFDQIEDILIKAQLV
jgi:hypothetical protein